MTPPLLRSRSVRSPLHPAIHWLGLGFYAAVLLFLLWRERLAERPLYALVLVGLPGLVELVAERFPLSWRARAALRVLSIVATLVFLAWTAWLLLLRSAPAH